MVDEIVAAETDDSDEPLVNIEFDANVIGLKRAEIEATGFTIP